MNSAVRNIRSPRRVLRRLSRRHAHLAGGVSVITAGRGKDMNGDDRYVGVVAVGRSADIDRQLNRGSSSWPILKRLRFRRQYSDRRSARYRRAIYRQGRTEGRGPVHRRPMDDTRVGSPVAGAPWRRSTASRRLSNAIPMPS